MDRTHRRTAARLLGPTITAALLALGLGASTASAADTGQVVSGTTLGTLALTAGAPVAFTTNFSPGSTATATGLLTATNTAASSTLQVSDAGSGAGHMVAATGATCANSDPRLTNALDTTVTGAGVTTTGSKAIPATASPATVATAAAPLAASILTTSYSQVFPSTQQMLTGCVYSLTATYTLQ